MNARQTSGMSLWLSTLVVVAIAFPVAGHAAGGSAPESMVRSAHHRIQAWDLPGAIELLAPLEKEWGADPEVRFLRALVDFHRGRHVEAARALEGLTLPDEYTAEVAGLIRGAAGVTKDYLEEKSEAGHFVIRYPAGMNGVLAPLALDALEKAREALKDLLGYAPPEQIAVEVMRGPADLAAMTGLREEEIKATNTIAVCKFNRIMFITPAALATGYPWLDTLNHEYAHYVTSRKTGDRVEVWLHETVSKMSETAWRGRPPAMRPDHEGMIAQGIKEGKLVTFAQMSPSMAKLPDDRTAALAFAEVFSAGLFITAKAGPGALGRMLDAIAAGRGMTGGFNAVGFDSMASFEEQWRAWLNARFSGKAVVERQFYRMKFKEGRGPKPGPDKDKDKGKDADMTESAGDPAARRFVRLGDLLIARGRPAAAAAEFTKASQTGGAKNPIIQNRLSMALLHSGKPAEAAAALSGLDEAYPDHLSTQMNLGRALLALEKPDPALKAFNQALWINPFDQEIWESLARIYKDRGDRKAHDAAMANLRVVRE